MGVAILEVGLPRGFHPGAESVAGGGGFWSRGRAEESFWAESQGSVFRGQGGQNLGI